jgi:TraG-like protein, N-terminal region
MMNVSSAIEIYTTVLGWFLYDGIWDALSDVGLLYVPLVVAVIRNWAMAWRMQGIDGAEAAIRNNWADIFTMMTVIALAGVPGFTVSPAGISHTTPCGGTTVSGGSTGTLYDKAFAAIDGKSAQVPIWWDLVMHVADGLNNAVVGLVPCSPDLRTYAYRIDNVRVADPIMRRQLELFTRDCWQKARAKFMAAQTPLPTNYQAADIDWIGSQFFQDTDGFYGNSNINLSMRASEEIPGFAYNAARDTEYQPGFIPIYGRPECKDWWDNAVSGLKPKLLGLVDPEAITQANIEINGDIMGAQNALLRKVIEPERAAFGRLLGINNYQSPYGNNSSGIAQGVAGAGLTLELASWWPKIYALRQAAPIGQSFILMGIYLFLPFVLLFSGFSVEVLYTTTVAIIGIKFLTPIWTLAVWIDNHMMEGLGIKWYSWMNLQEDKAATLVILNLVAMLMFVVLPIVWFMVIGWSGLSIHKTMDTFKGVTDPVESGSDKVSNEITKKILRR